MKKAAVAKATAKVTNIKDARKSASEKVAIEAPKLQAAVFTIEGIAPLVIERFSTKAKNMMRDKMLAGSQAKKGKVREARNFDTDYEGAFYRTEDGTPGMNAAAFRAALISACRIKNFKMTLAKLSLFIETPYLDAEDGTPLVLVKGKPERYEATVRNATGVADIRVRPMWRKWTITLNIAWDTGQFSAQDVTNLLATAGLQVGIGAGRPDSKSSAGLGFGRFKVVV